jgi:hypothetical protein
VPAEVVWGDQMGYSGMEPCDVVRKFPVQWLQQMFDHFLQSSIVFPSLFVPLQEFGAIESTPLLTRYGFHFRYMCSRLFCIISKFACGSL